MKKKDLIEAMKVIPDEAEVVISKCFVIDEEEELTAILDIPVSGIAYNNDEEKPEIRFMLTMEDVKQCFHPKDVKPIDDTLKLS